MCSISGAIGVSNADEQRAALRTAVERMNAALHHRGPDDNGIADCELRNANLRPARGCGEFSSDVGDPEIRNSKSAIRNFQSALGTPQSAILLGNTRLAIIDTSVAGHQPMLDPETENWITYNGETYNFRELRREIGDEFGPWHSQTDTEVVLRAYRKWGVGAFGKLRGMFAIAIWDALRQELILARDPFGIKPLYYYQGQDVRDLQDGERNSASARLSSANVFVFASEVRALLASGLVQRKLSDAGVVSYLTSGSVEAPLTIVAGVRQLLPGQCLRARVGHDARLEISIADFAARAAAEPVPVQERAQAVARLRAELEESVRLHLVSDVPLGVFLSGGMDSSALVALMSRVSQDKPKTFSVVFEEVGFTEASHSRAVAERFQTDHCEVQLSEVRLLEMLPAAVAALDQPTMDGINTFVVAKAVKDAGVTVALSGLGGDELFAGYPSFRRALKMHATSSTAKRFLRAVSGVGKQALNGSVPRNKFWQLAASNGGPEDVYRISRQLFAPDSITEITGRDCSAAASGIRSFAEDPVNAISELEMKGYMANTLLRDTDAMSMAHSLEVRVPFVDVEVVRYARSLPGEFKLPLHNGHLAKPLLADAVADLLPREFLARPKMGFTLPFEKWLRLGLQSEVSLVLKDRERLRDCGLAAEVVASLWDRFLHVPKKIGWSRPWSLYVLVKWCEINGVGA